MCGELEAPSIVCFQNDPHVCVQILRHCATMNLSNLYTTHLCYTLLRSSYRTSQDWQTNFRRNIIYFCWNIWLSRPSNRECFIRGDLHSFPRKIKRTRPNWFTRGARTRGLNSDDSGAAATGWIEFVAKVKKWRNKTLPSSGGHIVVQALSPLYPRGVSVLNVNSPKYCFDTTRPRSHHIVIIMLYTDTGYNTFM